MPLKVFKKKTVSYFDLQKIWSMMIMEKKSDTCLVKYYIDKSWKKLIYNILGVLHVKIGAPLSIFLNSPSKFLVTMYEMVK